MRPLLDRLGTTERAALVLLLVWVVWAAVAALLAGTTLSPLSPYVVAPVVLATGVVLGNVVAVRGDSVLVAASLLALSTLLFLAGAQTGGPALAPLDYANANAALAVQVIGLCGLAMIRALPRQRTLLAVAALAALAVIGINASRAALAVALPLVVVVAVVVRRSPLRRSRAVGARVVAIMATATAGAAVVLLAGRPDWPSWAVSALDPVRQALWRDARALWSRHPLTGSGPGSFEQFSALAADPDTASAHSSVLQVGAETGIVGVALFALIVLVGIGYAARAQPAGAVVAVAAWSALVVHSFTDHLLEFPPVVLVAGIMLGWAGATRSQWTGSARSEQLDVPEGERPGIG